MLKPFISLLMLTLLHVPCFAGNGSCERWEYAKLKDETKKELSDEYCRAVAHAIANASMAKASEEAAGKVLARGSYDRATQLQNEAYGRSMDQVSCMKQAEDVESMLKRRFKAKPPIRCQKDYEAAIPPSKG
jgi:hypothetical protein